MESEKMDAKKAKNLYDWDGSWRGYQQASLDGLNIVRMFEHQKSKWLYREALAAAKT